MTKSLENTIKDFYIPRSVMPLAESTIRFHATAMIDLMSGDISEDVSNLDLADTKISKKNLAIMIAGALNRISDKSNPINTNFLVAALSLLQLSDGDDQLMTVARRLAVKGMTPGAKPKKIKEETLDELSKPTLTNYLDANHEDRKALVGDKFDRPKIGKKFDRRMAGAILAGQKLKKPVTESINYKHKAIDDAHAKWNADIDHTVKMSEGGIGNLDRYRGTKEQIAKVKKFVDKHPHNRVPNALKMADHAGISDGLAAHFHKALKAVTESGMAKEKPFTQSDRIGRYLSDQRGRPRR